PHQHLKGAHRIFDGHTFLSSHIVIDVDQVLREVGIKVRMGFVDYGAGLKGCDEIVSNFFKSLKVSGTGLIEEAHFKTTGVTEPRNGGWGEELHPGVGDMARTLMKNFDDIIDRLLSLVPWNQVNDPHTERCSRHSVH